MPNVTQLLQAASAGDPRAAAELLPLVCDDCDACGASAGERAQRAHAATHRAVHEAWLKISSDSSGTGTGEHFFAAAAEQCAAFSWIGVGLALAAKRGAGEVCVDADELDIPAPAPDDQLLAVNEALAKFAKLDARKAELVKLRYFVGMTFEEAAGVMGIAVPTAKQWWAYARAWLGWRLRAQRLADHRQGSGRCGLRRDGHYSSFPSADECPKCAPIQAGRG
jgi:RNA polymerase sigma factor (TIGR02999 family)